MQTQKDDKTARVDAATWSLRHSVDQVRNQVAATVSRHVNSAAEHGKIRVLTAVHRRRCARKVLEGPASEPECREAMAWADSALAPVSGLRRLGGVVVALAVIAFVVVWPLTAVMGVGISFMEIAVCGLLILALAAPFALIGERDKAHRVAWYVGPTFDPRRTPHRI